MTTQVDRFVADLLAALPIREPAVEQCLPQAAVDALVSRIPQSEPAGGLVFALTVLLARFSKLEMRPFSAQLELLLGETCTHIAKFVSDDGSAFKDASAKMRGPKQQGHATMQAPKPMSTGLRKR